MDSSMPYVPQFLNIFVHCYLVLVNPLLLLFVLVVMLFVLQFLFPYWAVFPAGAFRFLASSSPSWGLQS